VGRESADVATRRCNISHACEAAIACARMASPSISSQWRLVGDPGNGSSASALLRGDRRFLDITASIAGANRQLVMGMRKFSSRSARPTGILSYDNF
jgi:hypothetical protein